MTPSPNRIKQAPPWLVRNEIRRELSAMRLTTNEEQVAYLKTIDMKSVHKRAHAVWTKSPLREDLLRELYDRLPSKKGDSPRLPATK